MSAIEILLEGALTEDGQLLLDEKPDLPPGRVQVLLRPLAARTQANQDLLKALDELWAAQQARGFQGYPVEELLAELDAMRDEWDEGREP